MASWASAVSPIGSASSSSLAGQERLLVGMSVESSTLLAQGLPAPFTFDSIRPRDPCLCGCLSPLCGWLARMLDQWFDGSRLRRSCNLWGRRSVGVLGALAAPQPSGIATMTGESPVDLVPTQ